MPKCLKNYKDPAKARKYRNRQRASNYAQTSVYPFKGRYADWEDELVLAHTIPDRTLSSMLQRSVVSIQMRRSRLKKILERNES